MSALFLDYVEDWARVRRFYPQAYSLEAIVSLGRERARLAPRHRERIASALTGDSGGIEKLASGAVAVLTGQQPGLFSGPLYAVLKAITAVKLARALEAAGIRAVPVYWVAGEDHDYEEIHWASVVDRESSLLKVRVDLSNDEASPVGWLRFDNDVTAAVSDCLAALPQSEFQDGIRSILESSYAPGVSPVTAFSRLMARVFEGTSLVFADPLHPELKEIAAPTLREAVEKNAAIRSAVLERNRALAEAGYHEQVKADGNFTGLFAYRGRSRQALRPDDLAGAFSRTSNDEVLKQRGAALMLSPNVLLRPAVQDSIFPTVAYIGGPAEIAYWAQAGAVYAALGRPMPAVFPRISASVIEARIARALRKYGIDLLDVFRGKEFMKRKAVAAVQGVEQFDQARDRITAELESLRPALSSVDPTLGGALETSRQKVLHQVETLRTKYVNAEAKRNESLEKHLDAITNSLYPEKKLQERVLNITSFLVRYGSGFIERLEQALELDSREHQVIEI